MMMMKGSFMLRFSRKERLSAPDDKVDLQEVAYGLGTSLFEIMAKIKRCVSISRKKGDRVKSL